MLALLLAVSCVGLPHAAAEERAYKLPIRVHVISSQVRPLNAAVSHSQVRALVARTNEVWQPANIVWELKSIEQRRLPHENQLVTALQGNGGLSRNQILGAIIHGHYDPATFDVFLVQNLTQLGGAPGVYLPEAQSLITSMRDPSGERDPGRILAHELGHALTLKHVRCTRRGNLMSPGCAAEDRTRLSADQMKAARTQAALGRPFAL